MKRIVLFVLVLMVLLCSCKQNAEVPDTYIQWEVEDYWASKDILASDYNSYEIKTIHSPDASTNTDTVDVTLLVNCPYGTYSVETQQVYQYSKSNDNWSLIRSDEWYNSTQIFNEAAFCKTWEGGGDYGENEIGNTYEIHIESIDFYSKTVSCSYSFITNIHDDFHVETVFYSGTDTFDFSNGLSIVEEKVTYNIYFSIWDGVQVYADSGIFRNN